MSDEIEIRALEGVEVASVRSESGKELPVIRGYAAVWGSLSTDLGGFRERFTLGAFAETAKDDDVRALFSHDTGKVLGRNRAGTLKLQEDAKGLAVEIYPPDTSAGRDAVESVRRRDITGMSFAFNVAPGGASWAHEGDYEVRTVKKAKLKEVSIVAFPAYPDTSVACRSLDAHKQEQEKLAAAAWVASRRSAVAEHIKEAATPEPDPGQRPAAAKG